MTEIKPICTLLAALTLGLTQPATAQVTAAQVTAQAKMPAAPGTVNVAPASKPRPVLWGGIGLPQTQWDGAHIAASDGSSVSKGQLYDGKYFVKFKAGKVSRIEMNFGGAGLDVAEVQQIARTLLPDDLKAPKQFAGPGGKSQVFSFQSASQGGPLHFQYDLAKPGAKTTTRLVIAAGSP